MVHYFNINLIDAKIFKYQFRNKKKPSKIIKIQLDENLLSDSTIQNFENRKEFLNYVCGRSRQIFQDGREFKSARQLQKNIVNRIQPMDEKICTPEIPRRGLGSKVRNYVNFFHKKSYDNF